MSSDSTSNYSQGNLNSPNFKPQEIYTFDRFRLDVRNLLLYENSQPVLLAPKVIETLLALVERRGEVVSKERLMNRLWADAFVEESNLTQNIYLLRKTLGNSADGKPLIETFRRRGYRFTAKIDEVADRANPDAALQPAESVQKARIRLTPNPAFDSLAVMPMTNDTADPGAEYLSDGITESLINRLSQLGQLRVVARNTAFLYKGQVVGAQDIGRQLGVSAVLTGRVLQLGERLIIRTELVDAANGWQLWGEQYDRLDSDILELQETIAQEIARKLQLTLTGEEHRLLTKRYTESSAAYHLYVKGRYYLNKRLIESIKRAAEFFQQAIDTDPAYAPAYVGLADCYPLLSLYGALTPQQAYPKARAAAFKALEIDNTLTKAYNSLGVVKLFYEWDWPGAEAAFQKALELNPGYPDAHQRYGMYLTATQRFDEAEAEFARACELDPLSLIIRTIGGYPFYYARRYGEAARCFREVIAIDSDYSMAHFRLGLTLAQQGNYQDAIAELQRSVQISNDRDAVAALAYVQGLAGERARAEAALDELAERQKIGFVSAYDRGLIYAGLGDSEAALDWLERAYEERSYWLIYLKVDPALDGLRANPRFARLAEKVFGADDLQVNPRAVTEKPLAAVADNQKTSSVKKTSLAIVATIAVLLALGFAAIYLFNSRTAKPTNGPAAAPNLKITRLTPDLNIQAASFTPDGKYLVYTLNEKGKNSVWLKDLATDSATQILPPMNENYHDVTISRDGFLYYSTERKNAPNKTVIRVPRAGGSEEVVATNLVSPFALSPDEKQVAYVNIRKQLMLGRADGSGEPRLVSERKGGWYESWGSQLSWSPDGAAIAICGARVENRRSVYELIEVRVSDGAEKIIPTPRWNYLDDVLWAADGSALLVLARVAETAPFQIWRVAYPSGETRRVTNDTIDYDGLVLSPDARRLVGLQRLSNYNLWLLPFDDLAKGRQITFGSTAQDGCYGLAFTADGKIIYTSPRSGNWDLWLMDASGEQRQLTKNTGGENAKPHPTADGRAVIFTSTRSGNNQIWRIDADGGNPKQLTEGFFADGPSLAPDGLIYFTAAEEIGRAYIAKMPLEGGKATAITPLVKIFDTPVASPDGRRLFCRLYDENSFSPWKCGLLSAETGELLKLFDFFIGGTAVWTPDSKAIIYSLQRNANLWRVEVQGDPRPQPLTHFESGFIRTFAISPDFKQIAISRGSETVEAVLLENF